MKRLAFILALTLTACVPGQNPLPKPFPNPIPIVIPDGTLTASAGTATLVNLEDGIGKDGALYLEGDGLKLLEPQKTQWDCRIYDLGWGCYRVPDMFKATPLTLNYSGSVRIGNLSYYLVGPDGSRELKIKSLKK